MGVRERERAVARKLREALRLTRPEFGKLIDKSPETIEGYEKEIPPDVITRLIELATERGFPKIATELQQEIAADPIPRADRWQRMLSEIRASGNPDITDAIEKNLRGFLIGIDALAGRPFGTTEKRIDIEIRAELDRKSRKLG